MPPAKDILVAVMGATGTGKSSFIRLATGDDSIVVGHGLQSTTTMVKEYRLRYQNFNFVLIDTPGFDDTNIPDTAILASITEWLTRSYRSGQKLSGILYLHRITDPRMQGSALRNFRMFQQLCGHDFYKQVILGTTFWSTMSRMANGDAVGQQRVDELVKTTGFWGNMVQKGSEVWRIPENRDAARNLLLKFAALSSATLQIQDEIVNRGIEESSTSAAKSAKAGELEKERAENERARKAAEDAYTQSLQAIQREKDREERRLEARGHAWLRQKERERRQIELERKRLEQERVRQEENARREMERLARVEAEMKEKSAKLQREAEVRELKLKGQIWRNRCEVLLTQLTSGIETGSVRFRVAVGLNTGVCDWCFSILTGTGHYKCAADTDIDVCKSCFESGKRCLNDEAHHVNYWWSENASSSCRRIISPPDLVMCDRCGNTVDEIYLHCCKCDNDDFDICVNCAVGGGDCRSFFFST